MSRGRDTDEKLAKLPREAGILRALVGALAGPIVVERALPTSGEPGYREAPAHERGSLSVPRVIQDAAELGFRFVGISAFSGLVGRIQREEWISDDGAVRMSSRRARAAGIEGTMSPYYLSTTFDDGSVILTWGRSPAPIPHTKRLKSRAGTGDLAIDLAEHRREIEQRQGRTPVIVDSIDECVALTRHFNANIATGSQVRSMLMVTLMRWGLRAALVIGLAVLVWKLLRALAIV